MTGPSSIPSPESAGPASAASPSLGLTVEEARAQLEHDGPNEVAATAPRPALRILRRQLASPLVLVLLGVAVVSRLLGEQVEATVILLIVTLNTALAFAQEYRAERALVALRRFVTRTARVRRSEATVAIPAAEVVRGDVVLLEVGDLVPADLVLQSAEALAMDEAALTGESMPVPKAPGAAAYLGTSVVSGFGQGVVRATGRATLLGRSARLLEAAAPESDFEHNMRGFSDLLVRIIALLTVFVFVANALLGKGWFDSFLFAVALAVGITPEVLPAIITITLASGALRMARDQVVVKRLAAVEDLGNVDILCCDKTGTLTLGEFALRDWVGADGTRDPAVLWRGALSAVGACGPPEAAAATPTDRAIWASAAIEHVRSDLGRSRVMDRVAFDFGRRRSSVLASTPGGRLLLVKGAAEAVLPLCTSVRDGEDVRPLTPDRRQRLVAAVTAYEEDGLRALAVADRATDRNTAGASDDCDLVLQGFLLFADPPKPGVGEALAQLRELGVGIRIMSGDSPVVTRRVSREAGIAPTSAVTVGGELVGLGPEELRRRVLECTVLARLTPDQKQQLVVALRASGHVVGFLGDGVNDAAALQAADVGISVDSGTDIAKAAADVILLQKSLAVLAGGIVEGRKTFANITKYILNTISANFGNMSTVALSSLFLPFIPLLPSQILLNNFLSDLPLLTIATDRVDPELLHRPRRWNIGAIARFMVIFGLLSALFDLLLIVVLVRWRLPIASFRTAWFIESACSEIFVTFAIRSRRAIWRSRPSGWLLWSSLATTVVAFTMPYLAAGRVWFQLFPLPGRVLAMVAIVLLLYVGAAEAGKRRFFRHLDL